MSPTRRTSFRQRLRGVVARPLELLGYDLIQRNYYSPVPDLGLIPPEVWTRRSEMPGVRFDPEAGLAMLRDQLAPYLAEYRPPARPTGSARDFYLENTLYESIDAETLYAMVRHLQPRQVVELGSGLSTLVIADARAKNGADAPAGHRVYDPFARADLAGVLGEIADLQLVGANDVPIEVFEELRSGDLLFVDTTHTVKVGSEVNRIILEILPRLAPGVIVHIHDIFLPWEYPRDFLTDRRFFWAEQYLLQAFLADNDRFEILFSAHALQRLYPEELSELIPSATARTRPAAFWLRRTG